MKLFKSLLIALTLTITFSACSKNDDIVIGENELHIDAKAYVNKHFNGIAIINVIKDQERTGNEYEVSLANGVTIEFDNNGNVEQIKSTKQLPDSVIPTAILFYVNANYADQFIKEWELNINDQEVKLSSGLELKFSKTGEFIRIDP